MQNKQGMGVPALPSGHSAEPEPTVSAVPVSGPNARTVLWTPGNIGWWEARLDTRRTVSVALGKTRGRKRVWAVEFKGRRGVKALAIPDDSMMALIEAVGRISGLEDAQRASWKTEECRAWKDGRVVIRWTAEGDAQPLSEGLSNNGK